MPFVVRNSGGPEYKTYGIHNGSRCRVKAWELDPKDEAAFNDTVSEEIVLKAMPKVLFTEMEQAMRQPYPGLPPNWFPMKPVDTYWTLDADSYIEIARRGFPLVPNFSTTIDGPRAKR